METPIRRLTTLPLAATAVVLSLAVLVPLSVYALFSMREWQEAGAPMHALTEPFFWTVGVSRSVGAVLLAFLLLYWRHPAAVAVTITAVWLAGPPVTFLYRGIVILAASAGQSSWAGGPLDWLGSAALFPTLVTAALLVPRNVRRAFGIS